MHRLSFGSIQSDRRCCLVKCPSFDAFNARLAELRTQTVGTLRTEISSVRSQGNLLYSALSSHQNGENAHNSRIAKNESGISDARGDRRQMEAARLAADAKHDQALADASQDRLRITNLAAAALEAAVANLQAQIDGLEGGEGVEELLADFQAQLDEIRKSIPPFRTRAILPVPAESSPE